MLLPEHSSTAGNLGTGGNSGNEWLKNGRQKARGVVGDQEGINTEGCSRDTVGGGGDSRPRYALIVSRRARHARCTARAFYSRITQESCSEHAQIRHELRHITLGRVFVFLSLNSYS